MLLGDILNGKEKSHLVVIHGKLFFFILRREASGNHDYIERNINAFLKKKTATFTHLDIAVQAFLVYLNYLADSISQNGRPLLYCFVKSLLKR